jgi:1,2-phenylacetyl-CoA epoxidase catalytic subunit
MTKQPIERKKIFASYTSDKGLITRMYKELKKLNYKRTHVPFNKWANELNRQFLKEEVQLINKYIKTCSASLAIKEMQSK